MAVFIVSEVNLRSNSLLSIRHYSVWTYTHLYKISRLRRTEAGPAFRVTAQWNRNRIKNQPPDNNEQFPHPTIRHPPPHNPERRLRKDREITASMQSCTPNHSLCSAGDGLLQYLSLWLKPQAINRPPLRGWTSASIYANPSSAEFREAVRQTSGNT